MDVDDVEDTTEMGEGNEGTVSGLATTVAARGSGELVVSVLTERVGAVAIPEGAVGDATLAVVVVVVADDEVVVGKGDEAADCLVKSGDEVTG